MDKRKRTIADKLAEMGETLTTWVNKNGLHFRIVNDLIEGRLKGARGVSLENRIKLENTFGNIFDD